MEGTIPYSGLPLGVLQTLDALEVQDVGIGALDAEGLQAMIVEDEVMAGGARSHQVGRGDDLLVVAVEEIDLEALDAHVGIVLHRGINGGGASQRIVANHVTPTGPEDDAHALVLAIGDKVRDVDVGVEILEQRLTAAPALVDDDILKTVLGGEVDII